MYCRMSASPRSEALLSLSSRSLTTSGRGWDQVSQHHTLSWYSRFTLSLNIPPSMLHLLSYRGPLHQDVRWQPKVDIICCMISSPLSCISLLHDHMHTDTLSITLYREAFNIVVLFWLFCGSLLCLLSMTVTKDEEMVQETIRLSIQQRGLTSYMQMEYPTIVCNKDNVCDANETKNNSSVEQWLTLSVVLT